MNTFLVFNHPWCSKPYPLDVVKRFTDSIVELPRAEGEEKKPATYEVEFTDEQLGTLISHALKGEFDFMVSGKYMHFDERGRRFSQR